MHKYTSVKVYKCTSIQVHKYTSIQHDIRDLGLSEWVLAKTWQSLRCKRVIKHKSKSIKMVLGKAGSE